jgi:hypothetical protein
MRIVLDYHIANMLQQKDAYNLIYWNFDAVNDMDLLRLTVQRTLDTKNLMTYPNATITANTLTLEQKNVPKSRDGFTSSIAFTKIRAACPQWIDPSSNDPAFRSSVVLWILGALFLAYVAGAITIAYFYGVGKMIRCICCCAFLFGKVPLGQGRLLIKLDHDEH